ncbi:ankyrin repeat-containing protein BDA1-like [Vicia villosa]|uniref:ankyrin repeat-containing protein BDA1-like n=1 Tax=Vicia villosa TaxID=3911 RepID=UPI00273C74FF|nr:ankyrin repeat-containing protein BDA1-like [Vicia villosa]
MNTKSGDQLKLSVETDNIDLLYEVIQDDPSILEIIDKNQFVDTPLHIAASMGHLEFATEIMNLKPSFAMKLNLQGHSPIHLAMDNLAHLTESLRKKGLTPLHIACQNGEVDLLPEFLNACPDSIEDVTARGESALHIVVINHQFKALQDDPSILENIDKNHFVETPLHIAASRGHLEFAVEIMNLKFSFATS